MFYKSISNSGSESTREMVETDSAEEGNERQNPHSNEGRETKSGSGTEFRQNTEESSNVVSQ